MVEEQGRGSTAFAAFSSALGFLTTRAQIAVASSRFFLSSLLPMLYISGCPIRLLCGKSGQGQNGTPGKRIFGWLTEREDHPTNESTWERRRFCSPHRSRFFSSLVFRSDQPSCRR
jgi:hypothetical protein